MLSRITATLPPAIARLSDSARQPGLIGSLPPVFASLNSHYPPYVFRLMREPTVEKFYQREAVPAFSGGYEYTLESGSGEIVFHKDEIDSGKIEVVQGYFWGIIDDHYVFMGEVLWQRRGAYKPPTPAIPAVGLYTVTNGLSGWDGGGYGMRPVKRGQRFTFRISSKAVAIQAGLARPGREYSFSKPRYAWYQRSSWLGCTQRGQVVAVYSEEIPFGGALDWRYGIARRGGRIHWLIAEGEKEPFTSFYSVPDNDGALVPIGMPYAVGDSIDAIEVAYEPAALNGKLPAVKSRISAETATNRLVSRVPPLHFSGQVLAFAQISVQLPAVMARFGDQERVGLYARLPGIIAELRSEPSFIVNLLYAQAPGVTANMVGIIPFKGKINQYIPGVKARLQEVIAYRISATLPAITARLSYFHRDSGIEFLTVGFTQTLTTPLILIAAEGLTINDTSGEVILIVDMHTAERVELLGRAGMGDLVDMLANEGLYVSFTNGDLARREALQYAINIATGAPSVYRGFDFNGFVSVDGIAYGWKSDGLYRIGADADDGDTIRALVDFGISDYGRAQRKRVAAAWLGIRTDGCTYVKVRADNGAEHIYRANASRDNHKAILAKGVAGRRWSFTLELEDASFASLDSIEIEIALLDRRFGGD